jgi:CRP-like cAMP-binding protein
MMKELDELKNFLRKITGDPDKDLSVLDKLCSVKDYDKGDFFLEHNNLPVYSGLVTKGAFREFYIDKNGRQYNKAFCFSGDFTGSYYDLNRNAYSTVAIQALTQSSVLVLRQTEFKKLFNSDPFWVRVAYEIAHNLLMKKFEKESQLLLLSAGERYDLLQKGHPELEQMIPAYHIASYLGITPISLSRIRANRK